MKAVKITTKKITWRSWTLHRIHNQEEIFDKIRAEREIHDRHKKLVVAAIGKGKTVIAAFNFKRGRKEQQ